MKCKGCEAEARPAPDHCRVVPLYCSRQCQQRTARRAWTIANPDKKRAANAAWTRRNPDKQREAISRWQKANPERTRAGWHKHRALQLAATPEDAPRITMSEIVAERGTDCGICGEPIDFTLPKSGASASIDHVVPLSRGGLHVIENLQPAHLSCNARKGNRVAA